MDSDYGPSDAPGDSGGGGVNLGGGGFDTGAYSDYGWGQSDNTPGYSSGDYGQSVFGALDRALAGQDLDRGSLATLAAAGLGKVDISPTQNVEQALAARNVQDILGYVAPAIANLAPGFGTLSTIGRVGAGLMSGTMTPGQALSMGLAGALGAKTGLPSGIFEGLFEGNVGKAAGAGVQGGLGSLASSISPFAGLAYGMSGLGPAIGKSVAESISGATGGGKSGGLGSLPGAGPAPSTSTAPTGNVYGDAGTNPDTYAVLAAIEQAAQEPAQPAWERQTVAGRYGPITNYEFGA